MDPQLIARLSRQHASRLSWFEEHAGNVVRRADLLEGHLAHPRRGIYKPADLKYALSIMITGRGQYPGDRIDRRSEGGWSIVYHQEDSEPGKEVYTNRGLIECLMHRVPVGVILGRQQANAQGEQFEILGIGVPIDWRDEYFTIESLGLAGSRASRPVSESLITPLAEELGQEVFSDSQLPPNDYEARRRILRKVVARRGQSTFREALIGAYSGRCAVTGCDVISVLEAAHLRPYRGPNSNTLLNGLLLRADIHTLVDLSLLAFDPDQRTVVISPLVQGSHYEYLSDVHLAEPKNRSQRPSRDALDSLWQRFISDAELRLVETI
jgi:putative restriction endonuclease